MQYLTKLKLKYAIPQESKYAIPQESKYAIPLETLPQRLKNSTTKSYKNINLEH